MLFNNPILYKIENHIKELNINKILKKDIDNFISINLYNRKPKKCETSNYTEFMEYLGYKKIRIKKVYYYEKDY